MKKEDKEKITDALEDLKEFEAIFKFEDVVWEIKAKDKDEALKIAEKGLTGKNTAFEDTSCYDIEIEEYKE